MGLTRLSGCLEQVTFTSYYIFFLYIVEYEYLSISLQLSLFSCTSTTLRPCYTPQFFHDQQLAIARYVAGELHSVTGVVSQFFVARSVARSRTQLYFSQRIAITGNTRTVYRPSSNLSRNFTAVLTRAHVHTSRFWFRGAIRDKLLRKLRCVTGLDLL